MRNDPLRGFSQFVVWCTLLLLAARSAAPARAEIPPTEASAAASERVFVSGVQDSFEKVRAAIEKASAASGRSYRVIVVGDTGGERDAATQLLESLIERWRRESAEGGERSGRPPEIGRAHV